MEGNQFPHGQSRSDSRCIRIVFARRQSSRLTLSQWIPIELFPIDQIAAPGNFQERDALLDRATSDREEVLPIRLGKAAIAFREVDRHRKCRAVELNGESPAGGCQRKSRCPGGGLGPLGEKMTKLPSREYQEE